MGVKITIAITQNSQNVANNTSNVTVKVNATWDYGSYNQLQKSGWLKIDGTTYDFTSSFNYGQSTSGSQTLYTKTVNVKHGSDGKKTLSCSASYTSGVSSGTVTASASKVLTTIPRKSTLSVVGDTRVLGQPLLFKVVQQSSSFTHEITYKCGTASGTAYSKGNYLAVTWTPPISLASQNTTGTSVSITFTITTYNGNTSVGSNAITVSCSIPDDVKPSCSIAITEDGTNHISTYGKAIQGVTKFRVTITPTPSHNSAIRTYAVTADGSAYKKASFTTGVLKNASAFNVRATVTDARGRTSDEAVASQAAFAYSRPAITKLTVHRCNADGTANDRGEYVKVVFSYTATSLSSQNTCTPVLKYKKASESAYSSISFADLANVFSVTDHSVTFAADSGNSYDVMLEVADNFDRATLTTTASTALTLMHWLASGLGMGIGKIAELENVLDIGFATRFFGGIKHPVLEPNTDLNNVRTPNTYMGKDISHHHYVNCPVSSGTFTLEVVGMGIDGQVKQRFTYCHKTDARTWERIYYGSTWGEWICVSDFDGQLLWSGVYYMNASQIATLAEPISKQRSGIVLVFSRYSDGEARDYHFQTFFVPKYQVEAHHGCGHTFMLTSDGSFGLFAAKYLYINDATIVGNDVNATTGTGACGITYANNGFVLRHVIGV